MAALRYVNKLADNIISPAMICPDFDVPDVLISEVLQSIAIAKINDRVTELCESNKFHFIYHQYIIRDFLYHGGVHLADPGTEILGGNIVNYINNFIL